MLVKERMSYPVISISPDMPILDALKIMREKRIRRFPVVDRYGNLVGFVSERDLLHAAPSDATSLNIWEINDLVSKITVDKVMTKEVITIAEDTPIEEAARIMVDHKIGGLPVLHQGELGGMITETDLFKIFLEIFGARDPGVRLTLLVPDVPDELPNLTQAIFASGGNILAMGTF